LDTLFEGEPSATRVPDLNPIGSVG